MKSLVCSDIHDHIQNFESALMVSNTAQCDSIICCGDLCSPFVLDVFHQNCELPFHMVFGNNDGDRFHLNQKADLINKQRKAGAQISLHGEYLLAGSGHQLSGIPPEVSIAVYHYPEMAQYIALSGKFKVVCCGHSHKPNIEKINDSLCINPGSIMGYIPGQPNPFVKPSCIIINWLTAELEIIEF